MKYVILHHQFFSYPIPKTSLQFSYTLLMVQDQKQINDFFHAELCETRDYEKFKRSIKNVLTSLQMNWLTHIGNRYKISLICRLKKQT